MAALKSEKIGTKNKVARDTEGRFPVIPESAREGDIAIVDIYLPSNRA